MKVLVVVASRHGATFELAQLVTSCLDSALTRTGIRAHVELADADEVTSLLDVDAVVLGSAVYFGHWLSSAHHFVDKHRSELALRPLWLFSSGPIDDPRAIEVATPADSLGARSHHVFGGRLHASDLSWSERTVVRALGVSDVDLRQLGDVTDWTTHIAATLAHEFPATTPSGRHSVAPGVTDEELLP
ncbi:flavodoxin domain-containing protein [Williamsia sp. CHRR-6]|uniref:flavodoxin domain-containing protein n=1 Tax=Williamsia sp. CHRR-6 TaxID=2835871 RepID=UPI001BD9B38C|nr:flavodoxin domain-containing protein [Williamsia sp. CHRR-6]MBT0566443.1 protoporphyrinogen oxidase [Williamsia sp. CHRR-6]